MKLAFNLQRKQNTWSIVRTIKFMKANKSTTNIFVMFSGLRRKRDENNLNFRSARLQSGRKYTRLSKGRLRPIFAPNFTLANKCILSWVKIDLWNKNRKEKFMLYFCFMTDGKTCYINLIWWISLTICSIKSEEILT